MTFKNSKCCHSYLIRASLIWSSKKCVLAILRYLSCEVVNGIFVRVCFEKMSSSKDAPTPMPKYVKFLLGGSAGWVYYRI